MSEIQSSPNWRFFTGLFLSFVLEPNSTSDYQGVLRQLSAAGILKVVVIHGQGSQIKATYDNPYLPEPSLTTIVNPKNLAQCFPEKVKNQQGHQLLLISYDDPPFTVASEKRLTGASKGFYELLMKRWNTTYSLVMPNGLTMLEDLNYNSNNTLFANKFPFDDRIFRNFDFILAKSYFKLGIIVTSRRNEDIWLQLNIFFSPTYLICNIPTIILLVILYNHAVLGRRGRRLIEYNCLVPVFLAQPATMRLSKQRKGFGFFFATTLWYAMFMIAIFNCFLTSEMITYFPNERITSIYDLFKHNISIFTTTNISEFLKHAKFELPNGLMARVQVANDTLWKSLEHENFAAFVVDLNFETVFINSATNINVYGRPKYYTLSRSIISLPFIHVFPKNSPFAFDFYKFHEMVDEGGLARYWMIKNQVDEFKYFSSGQLDSSSIPQDLKQLRFVFVILYFGLIIAIIVFFCEIIYHRFLTKDRRVKRIVVCPARNISK